MTHECPACEYMRLAFDKKAAFMPFSEAKELWSAIKARHATAEPALPEGVEIVIVRHGYGLHHVSTNTLLNDDGSTWAWRGHGNPAIWPSRECPEIIAAALKAPPPPRPATPDQVIVTDNPHVPMRQGVCAGCGRAWSDGHAEGCVVKAKTEELVPPNNAGDGLLDRWVKDEAVARKDPGDARSDRERVVDFARSQMAPLQRRIDELTNERDALAERLAEAERKLREATTARLPTYEEVSEALRVGLELRAKGEKHGT